MSQNKITKITKTVKKGVMGGALAVLMSSTLATNVNAACDATVCSTSEVGVGGVWSSYGGGKDAVVNNVGGYIGFSSRNTILNNRLHFSGSLQFGYGKQLSKVKDVIVPSRPFFLASVYLSTGINIATPDVPIFVSVLTGYDDNLTQGLNRRILILGGMIDAEIPAGKLRFLIGGGYGWVPYVTYRVGKSVNFESGGYNQAVLANIGLAYELSNGYSVYLRALGRYYRLNEAKNSGATLFPKANGFTVMAEVGLRVFTAYRAN